jgi:hypothetical protein
MKYLVFALMMNVAIAAPTAKSKNLPVSKEEMIVKQAHKGQDSKTGDKANQILKDKEDCDDKAKKVVEIKPESISLGGNTGCTLE